MERALATGQIKFYPNQRRRRVGNRKTLLLFRVSEFLRGKTHRILMSIILRVCWIGMVDSVVV